VTRLRLADARDTPNTNALGILLDGRDFVAEENVDPLFLRHERTQERFEFGLIEKGHVPPAVFPKFWHRHFKDRLVPRIREGHPVDIARRLTDCSDFVAKTESLKGTDRIPSKTHCTGKYDGLIRSFQDHDTQIRSR
jgi:hypothetical protein